MDTYIIRIWRCPDPRYCSKLMGVLDEFKHGEDDDGKFGEEKKNQVPFPCSTHSRRLVFAGMDQLKTVLNTIGLTGENDP